MILIPTQFERQAIAELIGDGHHRPLELCGFGAIAAAASTSRLIAQHKPASVFLVGIAGGYPNGPAIGTATSFGSVGCYGIGAGTGTEFQTSSQMGWPQWAESDPAIFDSISLDTTNAGTDVASSPQSTHQLLTVCAAAANATDVELRQKAFPNAIAEDMEGFGVAMACRLADVPLTIVRGISNVAGDRNKANWNTNSALQSAAKLTNQLLSAQ